MPRIAITPYHRIHDYCEAAMRAAGGDVSVRVLDLDGSVEDQLEGVDGLILPGGGDVDPSYYRETPHSTFSPAEPGRDAAEIALARAAVERNLPLLAICRGAQVLNVAFGGSLVQDIPSEVPGALTHTVRTSPTALAHEVSIERGTRLESIVGPRLRSGILDVNSRHHQAVNTLAPGFVITATAPDGVIEGIEHPSQPFCVGVQWHPENFWSTGEFQSLFDGLVDAAREFRSGISRI